MLSIRLCVEFPNNLVQRRGRRVLLCFSRSSTLQQVADILRVAFGGAKRIRPTIDPGIIPPPPVPFSPSPGRYSCPFHFCAPRLLAHSFVSRYYLRCVAFAYYLPAYVFMLFSIDYLIAQVR